MINQDIIAQDLFYKIRSRFPKMEMGDETGQATFEAAKGRFFDFDAVFNEHNLGTVSISINEPGSLKLYFNKNILEDADELTSKTWYSFLREMRKFAMKRLMSFDTRDISKTNLDKRDYGYLANKGPVMSESMMRGTSRTSYRPLEALQRTRLIIRHSKPVDESIPGARSRNLESLFIENAAGERFKYPFKHLAGAKAMQRHVANEGLPHDSIGQKIIKMSEDMAKLANFKHYVYREDLMNSDTNHIVERANIKLQELKDKINKLSLQHHYETFKAECEMGLGSEAPLIDEVTLEDYKDKFTVKSFKEDIAEVFPLLYSIMQENELDLEEVAQVEDQTAELNLEDVVAETPELQFNEWASTLVETRLSPEDLSKLNGLLSEHFPVGINGDNVTGSLEELGIELPDATKIQLAQLAEQQGPDADASSIVVEFLSKYQPEVYSALDINEPVQEGTQHQIVINGKAVDLQSLEVDGVDTRDYPDFSDAYISYGQFTDGTEMSDEELEMFTDQHGDIVHKLAYDSLHENVQEDGEGNSSIPEKIAELLAQGAKVDSRSLGAMGHIERVEGNHVTMRKLNSPGSKMRYSWLLTPKRLDGLELVQAGPNHYVLKDTDEAWGDEQQELDLGDKIRENMTQTPEERKAAAEYMAQIAQAIKSGEVSPENVEDEFFNTLPMMGVSDEKISAAWDRITGAGSQAPRRTMSDKDIDAELRGIEGGEEDDDANFLSQLRSKAKSGSIGQDTTGFGTGLDEMGEQPKKSSMKEVAEFIMGFYDRNTGNFPLGETGVKIKVEKEFGEKAGALAERLIQKLAAQSHESQMFEDIKVLSGQIKRESTLVAINKSPTKTAQVNESIEFGDLKKLAGIGAKPKATEQTGEVFDLKKLAGL